MTVTGELARPAIRFPLLRQAWQTVTFVHWRYEPAAIQPMLPAELRVDTRDGWAWVSMTALRMRHVRLPGMPALPRLSTFPETNLRTYVQGPDGKAGVWFFSLDAASTGITVGARLLLGAPYYRAELAISAADSIRYTGTRRRSSSVGYQLAVRPGQPLQPGELDNWLTRRWRAYTRHAGLLLETPVRHQSWPLRTAAITALEESVTAAAGLPAPPDAAFGRYSDGVADVAFGAARPVSRRQAGQRLVAGAEPSSVEAAGPASW